MLGGIMVGAAKVVQTDKKEGVKKQMAMSALPTIFNTLSF